eukprot:1136722-Pelagomonas_calceolata.AAC.5
MYNPIYCNPIQYALAEASRTVLSSNSALNLKSVCVRSVLAEASRTEPSSHSVRKGRQQAHLRVLSKATMAIFSSSEVHGCSDAQAEWRQSQSGACAEWRQSEHLKAVC